MIFNSIVSNYLFRSQPINDFILWTSTTGPVVQWKIEPYISGVFNYFLKFTYLRNVKLFFQKTSTNVLWTRTIAAVWPSAQTIMVHTVVPALVVILEMVLRVQVLLNGLCLFKLCENSFCCCCFFFLETCGYSGKTNRTHAPLDKLLERIITAIVFSINC